MCGIFGLWNLNATPVDVRLVIRATVALRHRGPDDEGYLLADMRSGRVVLCGGRDTPVSLNLPPVEQFADQAFDLAFGFRRLAIIDTSPAGHQPMPSQDGRHYLMLNGEIYNYRELREELIGLGHSFRSHSDSEVLLAAYQQWGAECLPKLVGMYAFVVLDLSERKLFLARDAFGIKPLYFAPELDHVAFGSEVPALLEVPWVSRRALPSRLFDYLRFGVTDHGDETMIRSIKQLPPAQYWTLTAERKSPTGYCYWRINDSHRTDLSFDTAAEKLRELFVDNVRLHMRSDVPIGAALSGGIDSSSIISVMRHLSPAADLRAFTFCADEPSVAEERWADLAARSARATIEKVRLSPADLAADLPQLIRAQGEPFGGTSIYAQYRVFRLAREAGVKVMLDGQGADELLAGYPPFLSARLASLIRSGRWGSAWKLLLPATAGSGRKRTQTLVEAAGLLLPTGLQGMGRKLVGREIMPDWLRTEWFSTRGLSMEPSWRGHGGELLREQLIEAAMRTSLPMLLRYEDRNSMAHSIESRVPFLTTALAEFVLALPEEYLIAGDGTTKSVFRRAMRGLVPNEILDRRDKIGFATPERQWLLELRPWAERLLCSDAAVAIPCLRMEVIRAEWERFVSGAAAYNPRIWQWINLIAWVDEFQVSFDG